MIHSLLGYGNYNGYVKKLKDDGVSPAKAKIAITTAMAVLVLLAIIELVVIVYSIYVAYHCADTDGMRVLWILAILFIPFVSLGTAIYGVVSGCVSHKYRPSQSDILRNMYHMY